MLSSMGTLVHLCMLPVHIEECVKYFAVSERHMHMCARPAGVGPGGQTFPCRAALLRVLGLLPKKHGGMCESFAAFAAYPCLTDPFRCRVRLPYKRHGVPWFKILNP